MQTTYSQMADLKVLCEQYYSNRFPLPEAFDALTLAEAISDHLEDSEATDTDIPASIFDKLEKQFEEIAA